MIRKLFRWKTIRLLAVVTLLTVVSAGTVSISYGQEGTWSPPRLLSDKNLSSWFPDVTTDATGQVHVVWASALLARDNKNLSRDYNTVVYVTSPDGRKWSEPSNVVALPIASGGDEATRPALFIDPYGTLHMTYRYTSVFYSQAPAPSAADAASWLQDRQISTPVQVAYFSRLTADSQDRLHLVFTENVYTLECPVCYHLFYRWSDDHGISWSSLTDISNLPIGTAKPQILIDPQDNIHLVWESGRGGSYGQLEDPTKVMYAASYDRGENWSSPVEFIAPGGIAKNITLGLDGQGKLLVVWLDLRQDQVYFQLSQDQGRSWSLPRPVPGVWGGWSVYPARLDSYAMATDSAGNVHLALVGRTISNQKSLNVIHVYWNGTTWSTPEVIATYTGDVAEWPRIAISNGNQLHVVWYVRAAASVWDSSPEKFVPHQVWYARGSTSAPAVRSVAWPTATPTATPWLKATPIVKPTATATPGPTPTLDPAVVQLAAPAEVTTFVYTDMDEILVLAKSLFPIALVIAAVVAIVRFWRH